MSSIRVRGVNFRVYPQDHEPRHIPGFIGSGEIIVDLRADGTIAVAQRKDAVRGTVTRTEVRKLLGAAGEAFSALADLWEEMHDASS